MILHVFSVYDKKVGAFMVPMFFRSKGEALRSFLDACGDDKSSQFVRHPEDYVFFELTTFDDSTGSFGEVINEPAFTALDAVHQLSER